MSACDAGATGTAKERCSEYDAELPATVHARMGAPARTLPRRPFALALGEWAQICYIGRHMKYWTAFT